ncbi:MAG: RNA-binding protein, partial [Clostridium sp.]|nr:RNA-binding protein [Clostridium sp.]
MLQIGKIQTLEIAKETKFGVYLIVPGGDENNRVLLPKGETTEDMKIGDTVSVYIYRDSEDRIIATTKFPPMELGDTYVLTVKEVNNIGAFLDWGLTKDLFLPYKQQTRPLKEGQQILVALYLDKSSRLCATMKVYEY